MTLGTILIPGVTLTHTDTTTNDLGFNEFSSMLLRLTFTSLLLLILVGCSSTGPEYDGAYYRQSVTPEQVADNIDGYKNQNVLWGGILINSINLEDGSELEVLAYPLSSNQRPDLNRDPIGRFLAREGEYLEPLDYAEGRVVTVTGQIARSHSGQVGSAAYIYPVINADQIYLWSKEGSGSKPQIHIGVGVGFGF